MLQSLQTLCPQCGNLTYFEYENVVNLAAEPNLRQRLIEGSLNYAKCPHCGFESQTDQPFLVNDPVNKQVIFFLPDPMDQAINEQIFKNVLKIIEPKAAYFQHPTLVNTWDALLALLRSQDEDKAEANSKNAHDMSSLWAFLFAPSWDERIHCINAHPELLGDTTLVLLTKNIRISRHENDIYFLRVFLLGRNILERCRLMGIEKAISEFSAIVELSEALNDEGLKALQWNWLDDGVYQFERFQTETLKSLAQPDNQTPDHLSYVIERLTEALETPTVKENPGLQALCRTLLGSTYRRLNGDN